MLRWLRFAGRAALVAALALGLLLGATVVLQMRREAAGVAPPPSSHSVDIGGGAISVLAFGAPGRPAVVIIPGTAAWSGFWAPSAQAMAQAGFFVVAVDLPPFGFSSRFEGEGFGRVEQAARLARLIDRLGLKKPIVLAHSVGAGAAVELALRAQEKLGGLVLVDGALALPPAGAEPPQDSALLKAALGAPFVARLAVDAVLVNPWLTRRLLAGLLARPEAANPAIVSILQTPYGRSGASVAYARWLPSLLLRDAGARSADPAAYASIALPVALIWGADDQVTPIAQGERLRTLIPGATLDALPGLGHIPHIEGEDAFVAAAVKRLQAMTAAR